MYLISYNKFLYSLLDFYVNNVETCTNNSSKHYLNYFFSASHEFAITEKIKWVQIKTGKSVPIFAVVYLLYTLIFCALSQQQWYKCLLLVLYLSQGDGTARVVGCCCITINPSSHRAQTNIGTGGSRLSRTAVKPDSRIARIFVAKFLCIIKLIIIIG